MGAAALDIGERYMNNSKNGDIHAKSKMSRKEYEKELHKLQVELCKLQDWVKEKGLRVIILFEGRDGAGKGGTIKAITERVSPRVFRLVALPAPSDREKSQMYVQRYLQYFPAAGEIVIFDRSWYNRAGVELVMGFCTKEQHRRFLELCPVFEQYSRARDQMLQATDSDTAPWHIVKSDDKKRARLNCIACLLRLIPYKPVRHERIKLPNRSKKGAYDDQATLEGRRFVPEEY
jgi:polyphosphate kinase 2 (PPK2 family)